MARYSFSLKKCAFYSVLHTGFYSFWSVFLDSAMADTGSRSEQWVPLEANEEILNAYITKMGVREGQVAFNEIFGFDALEYVPRPVKAVLLCFPICDASEKHAAEEAERISSGGQVCAPGVFYMKQTVGNACGTIGVLHAMGNLRVSEGLSIETGSYLDGFFKAVEAMSPVEIGSYLEGDRALEEVHEEAAQGGQSDVPEDLDNVMLHFICFSLVDGNLYELDGRKETPINHGPSSADTLLDDSIRVIREFMARDPDNLNFTMVALSQAC